MSGEVCETSLTFCRLLTRVIEIKKIPVITTHIIAPTISPHAKSTKSYWPTVTNMHSFCNGVVHSEGGYREFRKIPITKTKQTEHTALKTRLCRKPLPIGKQ